MGQAQQLVTITRELSDAVDRLRFAPPVTHVYNPLAYAREPHERYLTRYADSLKEILLLGMNPGPFGMAQTGVPFGEVALARDWLEVAARVAQPPVLHPKRPIQGFACPRSEVSGRRLWGWIRARFGTPAAFFSRFFIANYCPLCFMEEGGRNRTPDKLPKAERAPLLAACDEALRRTVDLLEPRLIIGVGAYATRRATAALAGRASPEIARILHPSPANPRANRGWVPVVEAQLAELGVALPAALPEVGEGT